MNILPLLQRLLTLLGFSIPADELDNGEAGPGTHDALAAFQALLELERTGEPNDETVRAIMTLTAQHLLIIAGLDIDDDDQWRARQGDSTTLALRVYQATYGLEVTGEPDEHTLQDLQERTDNPNFLVAGRVSDGEGQGVIACVVTAADLDRDTGARRPLGVPSRPNVDSHYRIEYTVRQVRELGKLRPDLVITGSGDDGVLQGELGPIERPRVHETQDLVLQAAVAPPPPPEPTIRWVVRGTVIDESGPARGVTVLAFDRDLSPDPQPLGEATATSGDGGFRIEYDADRFLAGEGERAPRKAAPDLVFKVTRGDESAPPAAVVRLLPSGDSTIAGDDLLVGFRAREDEEVRIELAPASPPQDTDEYTALWHAILPLLPESPPPDADDAARERLVCAAAVQFDEEARRDVTFVSREIDWPFELVERFGRACRLSGSVFDGQVSPAELYGLAASGFPDVRSLATASLAKIDGGLRRAANGTIPTVDAARSALVAELVRRLAPRSLLQPEFGEAEPFLAQSLELAGLDPDGQEQVLRFAADFEGTAPQFWKALADQPILNQHAGRIAYTMQLGALAEQNPALVAGLQSTFPEATSLRDLALQADDAQMTQAVAAAGIAIPADLPGADDEARRALFGKSLLGILRAADPTASIAKVAQTLSEAGAEGEPGGGAVSAVAAGFLNRIATQPDFDLLTSRLDDYRQFFDGDADQLDTAVDDVKRMQRLARVSTSETNFAGLVQMNVRGASDIPAMFTRAGFVAANTQTLAGAEEADLTYRRAAAMSAAALTAGVQAYQVAHDVQPYAMAGKTPEAVANWAGMFGSVELCECEQCRSWYGASAYLVDLLLFLEKRHRPDGPVPLDVLLARRPDLAHLKLTCENTNTMLPLIDLANEVLESYVVLRTDFGTMFTGHDVIDETAEELRASPRHVEQQAYEDLAAAVYPVTLPFTRWLEVVRAVLAKLGAPRAAVMAAFEPTAPAALAEPAAQQAAHLRRCESLGISPRERELITGLLPDGTPSPVGTAALYGFPPETTPAEVAAGVTTAAALQERLSLSFTELVDLVCGGFTNPGLQPGTAQALVFSGTEGDPALMSLAHKDGSPLGEGELLRLNAFVRLWRKLDWSAAELDAALRTFGCTDTITPAALDRLADLVALCERWDAAPTSLLVLWGDLDTWGKGAAYRRLFEDRTGGFATDDDLTLTFDGARPANAEKTLEAKQISVARALRLPPDDLPDLMTAAGLTPSDQTTVPNLSRLVRTATLAQRLELPGPQGYADLARLLELAHIDPVVGPAETLALAGLTARLASAELTVGHLAYLLGDPAVPPGAPDDAALDALGQTIADGLAQMRAGHPAPEPEALTADVLRDQLVLVVDPDTANFVAGLVAGSIQEPPQKHRDAMRDRLVSVFDAEGVTNLLPQWKLLRDGDEAEMDERQARLVAASAVVLPVVHDRLGRASVRTAVREAFELDEATAALLLDDATTLHAAAGATPMTELLKLANGGTARPTLRTLHRTALLATTFTLSAAELGYIAGHAERFDDIDLSNPAPGTAGEGVRRWQRLATYADLRDRLTRGKVTLLDVFTAEDTERVALLAVATQWPQKAVGDALAALGLTAADLIDERAVAALAPVLELAKATGTVPSVLKEWANQSPDRDQAEAVVAAARTRFGDAGWLEASQAIHDSLRERQRDALVAHVLTFAEIKAQHVTTLDELYEHFLIDVGTSSCTLTSRVVQANAAVQLFVQRVFLGLENRQDVPDAARLEPDAVDAEEWQWRKNYRVWEANRRVFLYPENYLLPELRDDRSPFFKELQSELGGGNLSAEEIERGVLNYLAKLEAASRLEIVGAYRELEASPPRDVLHVFGRTMTGVPRSYYYRRLEDKEWSPWEPVTVDIQGVERDDDTEVSGVHLLPVMWRGKLYLFWPQFTTKQDNEAPPEVNGKPVGAASGLTVKKPDPYWEIRLGWSRLEDGRWTPKQQSDVYFKLPKEVPPRKKKSTTIGKAGIYVPDQFVTEVAWEELAFIDGSQQARSRGAPNVLPRLQLQTRIDGDGALSISILDRRAGQRPVGGVRFADPYAAPVGGDARDSEPRVDLKIDYGHYQAQGGRAWLEVTYPHSGVDKVHLLESTGRYTVIPLAQQEASPLDSPFFFADAARAYFVQLWPNTESDYPQLSIPPAKLDPRLFAVVDRQGTLQPEMTTRPPAQFSSASPWLSASAELAPAVIKRAVTGAIVEAAGTTAVTPKAPIGMSAATTGVGRFTATDAVIDKLDSAVRDHACVDLSFAPTQRKSVQVRFHTFFHPHVATFAERLRRGGLPALFSLDTQRLGADDTSFEAYKPVTSRFRGPLPKHDIDFDPHGAYAAYNWEVFYHIPLYVADELRKAGHYGRALEAIRYVFDPLDSTPGTGSERFWHVLPLQSPNEPVAALFEALEPGGGEEKAAKREAVLDQLARIAAHPFQPFRIARLRHSAFQKAAVMLFCDICTDAGDALFRQDTREALGEAMQYYVMVAKVLGKRPEAVRRTNTVEAHSFAELRPRLTAIGNAFVEAENDPLFAGIGLAGDGQGGATALLSAARTLYFCIPQNEKLLGYWDTVQDRLFKLRNCMNIDGVVRQLDLFAPRIDPLLLARAAAAGIDPGSVLAGLNAPLPHYRFHILVRTALELAAEVKSLGAGLLSALEKEEAEHLALLRGDNELALLTVVEQARRWQVSEAKAGLKTLEATRAKAKHELEHQGRLLGLPISQIPDAPGIPADPPETLADVTPVVELMTNPGRFELVTGGSIMLSGAAVGAAVGESLAGPAGSLVGAAIGGLAGDVEMVDFDTGTKILRFEQDEIWESYLAAAYSMAGTALHALGSALALIPQAEIAAKPLGVGGSVGYGGEQLRAGAAIGADIMQALSTWSAFNAGVKEKQSRFVWRHQDLMLRFNSAILEIAQIDRQIIGAQIRVKIAENDLQVHQKQAEQRANELTYQRETKFTGEQTYQLLERSLGVLLKDAYQMAYDLAKQAERAYRFQVGDQAAVFIKPTHWDGRRRGLLAGEELYLDLQRMEKSFLQGDRREYEISKHVSLLQIDPAALIDLRTTGACEFELPEWLFNLDFPGHYFRRIKSVGVSLPCVVGPYTSVNGTLTLLSSTVRVKPTGNGEDAFWLDPVPVQSIATSSGQNDSGLFELNLRDDRFLPFEGAGAVSRWRFSLPQEFRSFDYEKMIADLGLLVRYTAREGGAKLAATQTAAVKQAIDTATEGAPLAQLFSVRHEFPGEWHRLVNTPGDAPRTEKLSIPLARFPLMFAGKKLRIEQIRLTTVARGELDVQPELRTPGDQKPVAFPAAGQDEGGVLQWSATTAEGGGALPSVAADPVKAVWELELAGPLQDLEDVLLVFGYTVS